MLEIISSLKSIGEGCTSSGRWAPNESNRCPVRKHITSGGLHQAINYTYSRKNFTSPTFEADLSACKLHKSTITAYQKIPREQQPPLDDAAVRDCMKAKGYKIETEAR